MQIQYRILLKLEAGDAEEASQQLEAYLDKAKQAEAGKLRSQKQIGTIEAAPLQSLNLIRNLLTGLGYMQEAV